MSRKRRPARKADAVQQVTEERATDIGAVSAPQFMNLGSVIQSPRRGTRDLLKVFNQSPWLRAIIGKIARSVAEVDWDLYAKRDGENFVPAASYLRKSPALRDQRRRKDLELGTMVEIEEHPLLELFNRGTGNPRLNGYNVRQVTQEHLDLVGEAYWMIERDGMAVPYSTWPMPPHWIAALPSQSNPFYTINAPGGLQVKVPFTEIIPFVDPDPEDPYGRGAGTATSLDDEIQIDEFAAKHQKSFFLNRARPDIIISGQFISKEDAKRLETQWLSDHQGFWKAFKPLFFSQKIDVKEITQTFESMQMTQVRQHERDMFINVFGIPPEKLGVIGDSKRSTINSADYFWTKDIIRPRLERLRGPIQSLLVPMFDPRLIFEYETPVIQDDEYQLEVMRAAPWTITINEWREKAGEDSLGPQGDVLLMPLNMQPVPVTGDDTPLPSPAQEALVNNALRGRAKLGDLPASVDASAIAADVARGVVSALADDFSGLKKILRKQATQEAR